MRQKPTDHELALIKSAIMLPLVLSIFERDGNKIETEKVFKTGYPYKLLIDQAMDKATADISRIKRELHRCGIKIHDGIKNESGLVHEYLCRGYTNRLSLMWELVRTEIEATMIYYLRSSSRLGGE